MTRHIPRSTLGLSEVEQMLTGHHRILVMGLPNAGKTTLALALTRRLNAVYWNGDAVRMALNTDLAFSPEDRIEQARRMGWLADQVVAGRHFAVCDLVCPTYETRDAFGPCFMVWVNTHRSTPYADTRAMFEAPAEVDYEVNTLDAEGHADKIAAILLQTTGFSWKKPTALFLGRYQPFHDGHRALILEGIERVGQALIAVRDTHTGGDDKNPFDFGQVRSRIVEKMNDYMYWIEIVRVPNITHVFYGRKVGYQIEQIDLPEAIQAISATEERRRLSHS